MELAHALLSATLVATVLGSANIHAGNLEKLVRANTEFAIDLYKEIAGQERESNVVYSPVSIAAGLAMLKLGTTGNSTSEIDQVLHLSDIEPSLVSSAFGELNGLLFDKVAENTTLKGANGAFISSKLKILQDYQNALNVFGAEIQELDFSNSKTSASVINKWISDKTGNQIPEMLTEDSINGVTSMLLTNTLYFTGEWHSGFNPKMTQERAFYVSHYKVIKTPFMFQRGKFRYRYIESMSLQVVEIPYAGQEISMIMLLPYDFNMEKVEKSLSYDNLIEWTKDLRYETVDLTMPKFKVEDAINLEEHLQTLGIKSIFDSNSADLSGITGDKSLSVDKILHKGVLEVKQLGGLVLAERDEAKQTPRSEMKMVYADHPFIFVIRNTKSSVTYLLGALKRPAGKEVSHDEL